MAKQNKNAVICPQKNATGGLQELTKHLEKEN